MDPKVSSRTQENKENHPNLFLFTNDKTVSTEKPANEDTTEVTVYIKIMEINLLKIQNNKLQSESSQKNSELSEYKRQYNFKVSKEDVQACKILKSNYLPEDNIVEISLPMNMNLRTTSFEAIHQIILALIEKEKKNLPSCAIKIEMLNYFDIFVAACCLEVEDLVLKLYEEIIRKELTVRVLIDIMLLALEYNLPNAGPQFYQTFREYWLYREGLSTKPTILTEKLFAAKDGHCLLYEQDEQFHVYENLELIFSFSPTVFKKVFENYRKAQFNKYLKPETRYHVLRVLRTRNHEGDEALWQSAYPHKYRLNYDHKNETILSAVRYTEYGPFYFFINFSNEMLYSDNYVGCIEPNPWGTVFDVYDDGMDEKGLAVLPKFICAPRKKIASISYSTNILGEAPRCFKVAFYDFLERKVSQVESMKPKFDEKNDCYTLNFYGRAKEASARNFILIYPDDPDSIMLMHGKTSKDIFNLDFRHPFNFIQAFGISLVSIGKKFCVA